MANLFSTRFIAGILRLAKSPRLKNFLRFDRDTLKEKDRETLFRRTDAIIPGYFSLVRFHDPLIYWKLDELSGTLAKDFSVNSNGGIYTSGTESPDFRQRPITDQADSSVLFNEGGVLEVESVYIEDFLLPEVFTFEVWLKMPDQDNVFLVHSGSTAFPDFHLFILPTTKNFQIVINGINVDIDNSEINFVDDKIHHLVVTVNKNFAEAKVYLDGKFITSATDAAWSAEYTATTTMSLMTIKTLSGGFSATGYLSDFAFYDYNLSAKEIQEHYQTGIFPINSPLNNYLNVVFVDAPRLYWRFNDTDLEDGDPIADFSGNDNAGSLVNPLDEDEIPLISETFSLLHNEEGAALDFAGNNATNYIILNPFDGMPTGIITIEMWLKTTMYPESIGQALFNYQTAEGDEFLIYMMGPGNSSLAFEVNDEQTVLPISETPLNDGRIHHLVVTWSVARGTLETFIDGKSVGTVAPSSGTAYVTALTPGGSLVVGQEQDSVGGGFVATQSYDGVLQELAIYPHLLTPTRIKEHYIAGSRGFDIPLDTTIETVNDRSLVSEGTTSSFVFNNDTLGGVATLLADESIPAGDGSKMPSWEIITDESTPGIWQEDPLPGFNILEDGMYNISGAIKWRVDAGEPADPTGIKIGCWITTADVGLISWGTTETYTGGTPGGGNGWSNLFAETASINRYLLKGDIVYFVWYSNASTASHPPSSFLSDSFFSIAKIGRTTLVGLTTTNSVPLCSMRLSAAQDLAGSANLFVDVGLDEAITDTGSAYDTINNLWVCPVTGVYDIQLTLNVTRAAGLGDCRLLTQLKSVNTSTFADIEEIYRGQDQTIDSNGVYAMGRVSVVKECTAGEGLRFGLFINSDHITDRAISSGGSPELRTFASFVKIDDTEILVPPTTRLPDGQIYIGNADDVPKGKIMSGDATITNEGVVTVSAASGGLLENRLFVGDGDDLADGSVIGGDVSVDWASAGSANITINDSVIGGELSASNFDAEQLNRCWAYRSATYTVSGAGYHQVLLNAAVYDTGVDFNSATNTWTCPQDGVYQIAAGVYTSFIALGDIFHTYIYKNGSAVVLGSGARQPPTAAGQILAEVNAVIQLDATDAITFWIYCQDTSYQINGGSKNTRMMVQRVK